jgi:hypothetical protein
MLKNEIRKINQFKRLAKVKKKKTIKTDGGWNHKKSILKMISNKLNNNKNNKDQIWYIKKN